MSKVLIVAFLLAVCALKSFSQPTGATFGSITLNDLNDDLFSKDTAVAVIVFDKGEAIIDPYSATGTVFKRHIRIKVLRPEALSDWGNFKFKIGREGQMKVKGATYNRENGAIQKSDLDDASVVRAMFDRNTEMIRIAFPNVRVGSLIELSTVVRYPTLIAPAWQFQYSVPVRWSEYTISVPVENIVYHLSGTIKPALHEAKYDGKHLHWILKDIPAFTTEPFMPNEEVYVAEVNFATQFTKWEGIYHELTASPRFGAVIHQYRFLKNIVDDLTKGITDEKAKIRVISDYLKKRVAFNGVYDYLGSDPDEVLNKKSGSVGDINLLLASMLEKAGLRVSMVLLSTREHGFILEELPALWQFNYVVCEVATKDGSLLADATEALLPFDLLPPRCYNHKGFLIGTGQFGWIGVEPKQREKITMDVSVTLSQTGALKGKVTAYKDGYAAFDMRKEFAEISGGTYNIDLGNKLCKIDHPEVLNMTSLEKPVQESCEISVEEFGITANDMIYFNPNLFLKDDSNPFKSALRSYPVDFGKITDHTVVYNIIIPDGFEVDELPKNSVTVLPENAARCTMSFSHIGNKITVVSKTQINKALFQPGEYPGLKEFYGKMVARKAENIVLKKI
ncbi:MAG: DUF3857 domain-containing protein [Chryseolinea sp.]